MEAIISIMLISLFVLGIFYFFNLQNKNIVFFVDDQHSEDILNEAYIFLNNFSYKDIPAWLYSLSYKKDPGQDTGSMFLKIISENDNLVEEGKYVNYRWEALVEYNLAMDKTLFKRTILIEDVPSPFILQKMKKITVWVWYPGCDYSWNPCKKKDFLITEQNSYE